MLAATALSLALALAPQAPPSLKPCKGESDCISSNGLEAPNHFQAPLAFAPLDLSFDSFQFCCFFLSCIASSNTGTIPSCAETVELHGGCSP